MFEDSAPQTGLATRGEDGPPDRGRGGRFDPGMAAPFVEKLLLEPRRRAYRSRLGKIRCTWPSPTVSCPLARPANYSRLLGNGLSVSCVGTETIGSSS